MTINLDWLPLAVFILVAGFLILAAIGAMMPDEPGKNPESDTKKAARDIELILIALWFK